MKIFKITLLITALTCLTLACNKKDDDILPSNNNTSNYNIEVLAQEQNNSENRVIPVSEIENGITIEGGATSKSGSLPTPNGNIDFQINTDKQEAFQEVGFNIKFSSSDDIQGAYILFKDAEGNKLNNYFDIPLTSLQAKTVNKKTVRSNKRKKRLTQSKISTGDSDYIININFDDIAPGSFCYEICLYDTNNSISAIQSICVEVESWGGNASIVGEWLNESSSGGNGNSGIFPIEWNLEDIYCESGQTKTILYFENINETWILSLNADGTYYESFEGSNKYLDYVQSESTCSAVYSDAENYHDAYTGKWAYNEDTGNFTMIDFKYEDLLESFSDDIPGGSIYLDDNFTTAEVINGKLNITASFPEYGETLTAQGIFIKK